METPDSSTWKKQQEELRRKMSDPALRWKQLNEALAWGEQQATVPRSTPASRVAEQLRKQAANES